MNKSYCPMCGVHKWYKKIKEPQNSPAPKPHPAKEPLAEKPPSVHQSVSVKPELIRELADVDDVEMILTEEISISESNEKNIKIMRTIIIILLLLLNLAAVNALVKRNKASSKVTIYNQVIEHINNNELQKAGEIIIDFRDGDEKFFLLALVYFKGNNYSKARDNLLLVQDNPLYSSYSEAMLGYVYYQEGNYQESYNSFRKALRSLPGLKNLNENFNNIRLYIVKDQ